MEKMMMIMRKDGFVRFGIDDGMTWSTHKEIRI